MSVERAYIFPNILPENGLIFPLAQLFEELVFLRPVEDDLPEIDTPFSSEIADQPGSGGCINFSCPAPLAGDRERFLILLRDIRSRPDDYTGHLGNLSAGLGNMVRPNEQEHAIIDTLLHQTGIRAGHKDNTPELEKGQEKNASSALLWQARLLLKLGESLDLNQAEIRRDLDRMTRQQGELLRELREGQKEELAEFTELAFPSCNTDNEISLKQQRLRLKAWSHLFALSPDRFETTAFISQSSDAVESLLEYYRQEYDGIAKQLPKPLLILPLPAFFDEEEEALLCRDRFQKEAAELIAAIRALLTSTPSADSIFSEKSETAWTDLLERHYPAAKHGRCTLTLYLFPEITPQRLFFETFAAQKDLFAKLAGDTTGRRTVLGLLAR